MIVSPDPQTLRAAYAADLIWKEAVCRDLCRARLKDARTDVTPYLRMQQLICWTPEVARLGYMEAEVS